MNKLSELIDSVRKIWMPSHRRYERLCVLAATGQLGGAHMWELNEHIGNCDSCRKFLESIAQVSLQAMPGLAENRAQAAADVVPPEGIRARFLERLASEGPSTAKGPMLRPFPFSIMRPFPFSPERRAGQGFAETKRPQKESSTIFSPLLWRSVASVTGCAIIAIGAYYVGAHRARRTPHELTQARPSVPPSPDVKPPAADPDRVSELERKKAELRATLIRLRRKLSTAENEKEALSNELDAAKEKLATLTAEAHSASQLFSMDRQASEQVSALQEQVQSLSQRLAESEVKLGIQKQTSDEVSARLETTTAELQRERDLKSAKTELGDLVAARNLHIVDVYDADPTGKRQRCFGRVFYIEGKSLVFYAYDLDAPSRFKANVVFHVWGGKAGVKEVTHSLGILRKDDAGQSRWAMTFDDPKVLAQINSVFVTAEPANKHYGEPHGKKILYAYFGTPPNHP